MDGASGKEDERKEYRAGNCNDCNRQFCLGYNLPICKGAGMEDVFTMCFRESPSPLSGAISCGICKGWLIVCGPPERDSRKDETVVFIFIFATAGLLGWAAMKPWVGKWVEVGYIAKRAVLRMKWDGG